MSLSPTAAHFAAVAPIWDAFFAGEISVSKRDRLLAVFRDTLAASPLSR